MVEMDWGDWGAVHGGRQYLVGSRGGETENEAVGWEIE